MSGFRKVCGLLLPLMWLGCSGQILQGFLPGQDGGPSIGPAGDGGAGGQTDGGATSDDPLAGLPPPHLRYYVSPSGDDTQDGLSAEHAWKTVAHVNAATFVPGDQVLFQRGAAWNESLLVPSDGSATQPLVFASYGSGAKPRFYGSDALEPALFRPGSVSGTYDYSLGSDINCVATDTEFLVSVQSLTSVDSASGDVTLKSGAYVLNGATLTVSTGSDPRTGSPPVRVCRRVFGVQVLQHNHVILRDLVTDGTAIFDAGYGFTIQSTDDVQLQRCEAYHAGKHHFGAIESRGFVGTNLYAAYALPAQGAGGATALVSFGANGARPNQTSEWRDCTVEHMEDSSSPGSFYPAWYQHGAELTSVLIHGLVVHDATVTLNNGDNTSGSMRMEGGWLDDARLEVLGDGIVVDGVKLTGPQATIDVKGSNIILQNILLSGNNLAGQWEQTAVLFRNAGSTLRLSTIVVDAAAPGGNTCVAFDKESHQDENHVEIIDSEPSNTHLYGNVFVAPGNVVANWRDKPDSAVLGDSGHNLFPTAATFHEIASGVTHSYAEWQSLGFDASSRVGDPHFTDAAGGNYSLQSGSPAIDAAPLDASLFTHVAAPTDFLGAARLHGAAYDMGAFEHP